MIKAVILLHNSNFEKKMYVFLFFKTKFNDFKTFKKVDEDLSYY